MSLEILPEEILLTIAIKLDYKQICNLPLNKHWWSKTTNNGFWRQKMMQDFPTIIVPKENDYLMRYCWYSMYDQNLQKFNQTLLACPYEIPDELSTMISNMIFELGPVVHEEISKVFDRMYHSDYEFDDYFMEMMGKGIDDCFCYQQKQRKNTLETLQQEENYKLLQALPITQEEDKNSKNMRKKKIKSYKLDSKIQNDELLLIDLVSEIKKTHEQRKVKKEGSEWWDLDCKMYDYEYELLVLLENIDKNRKKRDRISEALSILN